jgi:hypothetical protein
MYWHVVATGGYFMRDLEAYIGKLPYESSCAGNIKKSDFTVVSPGTSGTSSSTVLNFLTSHLHVNRSSK